MWLHPLHFHDPDGARDVPVPLRRPRMRSSSKVQPLSQVVSDGVSLDQPQNPVGHFIVDAVEFAARQTVMGESPSTERVVTVSILESRLCAWTAGDERRVPLDPEGFQGQESRLATACDSTLLLDVPLAMAEIDFWCSGVTSRSRSKELHDERLALEGAASGHNQYCFFVVVPRSKCDGGETDGPDAWIVIVSGGPSGLHSALASLSVNGAVRSDMHRAFDMGALLGSGGCASVYVARHTETYQRRRIDTGATMGCGTSADDTSVAIKIVHDSSGSSDALVEAEVKVLRAVQTHPHIIGFVGLFRTIDAGDAAVIEGTRRWALAQEFAPGGDLFDLLRSCGTCDESQASGIVSGLLSALAHVHALGIIHRDVKPENILIGANARPLLADFGVACFLDDLVAMQKRCGSPGYAAPELLKGDTFGTQIDIFSTGVTLYFLMSGQLPFWGPDVKTTLAKTTKCRVNLEQNERLMSLRTRVKRFLLSLLRREPEARPTAAQALRSEWLNPRHGSRHHTETSTSLDSESACPTFCSYADNTECDLPFSSSGSANSETFTACSTDKLAKKCLAAGLHAPSVAPSASTSASPVAAPSSLPPSWSSSTASPGCFSDALVAAPDTAAPAKSSSFFPNSPSIGSGAPVSGARVPMPPTQALVARRPVHRVFRKIGKDIEAEPGTPATQTRTDGHDELVTSSAVVRRAVSLQPGAGASVTVGDVGASAFCPAVTGDVASARPPPAATSRPAASQDELLESQFQSDPGIVAVSAEASLRRSSSKGVMCYSRWRRWIPKALSSPRGAAPSCQPQSGDHGSLVPHAGASSPSAPLEAEAAAGPSSAVPPPAVGSSTRSTSAVALAREALPMRTSFTRLTRGHTKHTTASSDPQGTTSPRLPHDSDVRSGSHSLAGARSRVGSESALADHTDDTLEVQHVEHAERPSFGRRLSACVTGGLFHFSRAQVHEFQVQQRSTTLSSSRCRHVFRVTGLPHVTCPGGATGSAEPVHTSEASDGGWTSFSSMHGCESESTSWKSASSALTSGDTEDVFRDRESWKSDASPRRSESGSVPYNSASGSLYMQEDNVMSELPSEDCAPVYLPSVSHRSRVFKRFTPAAQGSLPVYRRKLRSYYAQQEKSILFDDDDSQPNIDTDSMLNSYSSSSAGDIEIAERHSCGARRENVGPFS